MTRRLLAVCLLTYPKTQRQRDGEYLLDLALELAANSGIGRQAASLIRGGLHSRRRRSRLLAVGAAVLIVVGGGLTAGSTGLAQVEVYACSDARRVVALRVPMTRIGARGFLALVLLIVLSSLPTAAPIAAGAAVRRDDAVRRSLSTFLDRVLPAGASGTLVAVRGRTVFCRGFGWADRWDGVAADCDTVYDIGSITKQFTAAAILRLEMMGRLDVHDPISRFFRPVPPDKAAITVQQLLTHTAGLQDTLGGDYEPLTRRRLVADAMASPLRSSPGSTYHYSNLGYSLLAAIVQESSGMGYERFLARYLFAPAGMTRTGYVLPRWSRADVAVEYDARGRSQGRPFDHPWAANGPWWNLRGNGGMLSTARDQVRWHRALQHATVLDRCARRELFRPRVREGPGADSRYGYGWVLLDTVLGRIAWHNGGNGWSYGELARMLGRDTMVFWVTNRVRSGPAGWDLERLANTITSGVLLRLAAARP